nr:2OG-Fe(II) oxygenase [uncultured Sphingosinicella sp.]
MYLWEIGETVRNTLATRENVFQVPATGLEIFVVRGFLGEEECAGLIERIDADLKPSKLLADDPDPEFRTSQTCELGAADPLVHHVDQRIAAFMGMDPSFAETLQGQRYAVGQQFKPHHDFFYTDQPYWPAQEKSGGQRTWTAMAFLNAPEAGGQTFFERAGVRITPKAGNLLMWNNLDLAGEPNTYSLHQGMPVEAGVKYIVTKWFRGRRWGYQQD